MQREDRDDSNSYQIRKLARYERTYEALLKKHYRKDAKSRKEFEQVIEDLLEELRINPCSNEISELEPFPAKTADPTIEFRKKRWRRLPGLQGAARFGRLIFVVCEQKKLVYLVWIYTHAEYSEPNSRPPDQELKAEINYVKQVIVSVEADEEPEA
ncbi:MAG: hypothetical protein RMY28_023205 [Nostoc sp. ChiSLP01]|nr:hypothetical protein [Nostoc sp. CmiSLP01]MDZ8288530.1 hypothetical protein [Nostoc sp. ChiSLP01]